MAKSCLGRKQKQSHLQHKVPSPQQSCNNFGKDWETGATFTSQQSHVITAAKSMPAKLNSAALTAQISPSFSAAIQRNSTGWSSVSFYTTRRRCKGFSPQTTTPLIINTQAHVHNILKSSEQVVLHLIIHFKFSTCMKLCKIMVLLIFLNSLSGFLKAIGRCLTSTMMNYKHIP